MTDGNENGVSVNGRGPNGQFAKGNSGGPGRPSGVSHIQFADTITAEAKARGVDLKVVVWESFEALRKNIQEDRDVPSIKLMLDRLCGVLPKDPINIDARSVYLGPGAPRDADKEEFLSSVARILADVTGEE